MKTHRNNMIRIVVIFSLAIIASFIAENYLYSFFGDRFCTGNINAEVCRYGYRNTHGATYHWGWRHWLFMLMGAVLFIYNIVLIIENKKD